MYLNLYFYMIMFFISMFMFSYLYYYILLTLMSLEFLMLSLMMMMMMIYYINQNYMIIMYYLVFVVCESVLGLSLLILMIRNKGNDSISWLNLMLW